MTPPAPLRIAFFTGASLTPHIAALSHLRMTVFREWPYLYDGDQTQEAAHLAEFAKAPSAGLAVAFDGQTPVGLSSCVRLVEEGDALTQPFRDGGIDPARVFYFGESVLLAPYRGQGVGVTFFAEREAHARRVSSCDYAAFCAVVRPDDHPLRPPGATSLAGFWRKRGYTPYPDLECRFRWKQVDTAERVENRLSFWMKSLTGAPLP